jgi:MFS family permease
MTMIGITSPPLSETDHSEQLRRAVIASTVGTTIEWYDFLLYGTVTGLVFGKLFFPESDPLVGVLQAFAVYSVGFIARPIGAAIFGHYGDRIGRKGALIATLLLTGLATFAVGFVPTYQHAGVWGAVILTVIRFIQGVGVGGEWGGSALLSMEWARSNAHRGFITSWSQIGGPAGAMLANIAVLVFSWISGDHFLIWGWRIPFMLSIIMVGVGLYIRLGILETPVFQRLLVENRTERVPVVEVIKRQPRSIILTALARMGEQGRLRLRYPDPPYPARFPAHVTQHGGDHLVRHDPTRRAFVGSHRTSAHVYHRLGCDRDIRLHLLRFIEYDRARLDLSRHRAVVRHERPDVRSSGGADRGMLHPPFAL